MLAAKTPPTGTKSAATTEKGKEPARPSAATPVNPVWGQLALGSRPKPAPAPPEDPRLHEGTRGGVAVSDSDPARLPATKELAAGLGSQLGITWPVRVHIDDHAERELGGRSSRGAALGESVYIRPRGFDPRAASGRRLLAHELAHAAQARVPAGAGALRSMAESEAGAVADAFAAGRRVSRPAHALGGTTAAHDDGDKAKEDEFLKVPKTYKFQVILSGVYFTPDPPDQKWVGNIDRRLQTEAAVLKALVGKNYSVQLVRDTTAYLEGRGMNWVNVPLGPSAQDETCKPHHVETPIASWVVEYLTNVHQPPVPVLLTESQLKTIRAQADIKQIYAYFKQKDWLFYRWVSEPILTGMLLNNRQVLEGFQAALGNDNAMTQALAAYTEKISPYLNAFNYVRLDRALTGEEAYRALWHLPPADPASTAKQPPVDEDSQADDHLALQFLYDMQSHNTTQEIAKAEDDAAFRKKIFDDWAARMKLKKESLEGDVTVRDAPGKAVQAPDPSSMSAYPQLEAPYYDRQVKADTLFKMFVYTPNPWEHFISWHYSWEVIRVPHDEWSKADEVGKDPTAVGEDYGSFGRVLGTRFSRTVSNAEADVKRTFFRIENLLGPPGTGPTSMALANAALGSIGAVIKTSFGKFAERASEYGPTFEEPGVYVVRCRATRPEDEKTLIHKMPSVAYLRLWVRKPEEITRDRVAVENMTAQMHDARLDAIQEKLKNINLPADERQRLEDEARNIVNAVYGNAEAQLNTELRQFEKIKSTPEQWDRLSQKDKESVDKRIEEIKFITAKRADWLKGFGDDAVGSPEKIVAYFIGREGIGANRPMRLLLEVVKMKAAEGSYRYAVLDSTGKESEHRVGPEKATRADAITEAIRGLLEDVGYGRGKVTFSIPKGAADVGAKEGEVRTITIERSDKQLMLEGLENLALVASIAAIAAAPFTGGQSLVLLIPIGVVGAIPAAYRLSHRVSEGTFEWDMATAMDILNVLGAAAGLGQFATSLKLIQVSTRVWTVVGLGMDALQGIAGTYDLIEKLQAIDPNLPEGARVAEAMMIVGNALLQLGIAVGGRMAAEGVARKAKIEAGATPEANPNVTRAPVEMAAPLAEAGFKDVPVLVDKSIKEPTMKVMFDRDGYGLPSDIYIIAGDMPPETMRSMVGSHVETVQLLKKYSGFCGWVRTLIDRFNALIHSKRFVAPGTRGWTAAAEVNKLTKIITDYTQKIADGHVNPVDGEAYLEYLKGEVKKYEQVINEVEQGPEFIAAQAPKGADAVAHGYPPPPDYHYYVEESPGVFQLRAHVGYESKPKMVVPKQHGEKGWDIIERPPDTGLKPPPPTEVKPADAQAGQPPAPPTDKPPAQPGAQPAEQPPAQPADKKPADTATDKPAEKPTEKPATPPAAPAEKPAAPKAPTLDPAQLQMDVPRALGVASASVDIQLGPADRIRIVPPAESGKGYVVHIPADATAGQVESAVARHRDLARQRPADLSSIPVEKGKPTWTAAMEAEYRGRPTAGEGYFWRIQDGKLQYVREAPEEGVAPKPKMVWDEAKGALVVDTGARESKSWPADKPTSKETAFEDLGGNDPKSPFGKWVKLMEQLGFKREDLVNGLQEPKGLTYDTVRHNLKKQPQFAEAIRKWLTDPGELQKRYPDEFKGVDQTKDKAKYDAAVRKAQHRAVVEIDQYLALKDATNWTERWYVELFGKVADEKGSTVSSVESQVFFDKEKLTAAGIDVSGSRQADVVVTNEAAAAKDPGAKPVQKNILKDVKSHEGALTPDDKAQFADYKKLIGRDAPRTDGTTVKIDRVVEVFLDPRGAKANAEFIATELGLPTGASGQVSFEVFNTRGERRLFTGADFQKLGNPAALQAAIIAFCDT